MILMYFEFWYAVSQTDERLFKKHEAQKKDK